MLARVHAGFFTLESTLTITEDGTFKPLRSPAELFAQFNPQPPPPERSGVPTRRETLSPQTPRYALRKHLGVWHLIFDGKEAFVRHERGLFYVAWLLYHPDETPIHALDLAAKIPEIYRNQLGLTQLTDPATGKAAPLLSGARIQERSLALDDAQSMRALFKKQRELEAILDSEDESEPVKAEALRELEALAQFQRQHAHASKDAARTQIRTIQTAIRRLHRNLTQALETTGKPHPVLHPFAEHLQKHLLAPSALRFRSQAEKHELSSLYEDKIKRMGNAGRNGGEYYTPRPLIAAGKTHPSDATLEDFRALRRCVNKAALSGRLSAYYLDSTWKIRSARY